MSGKVRIFSVPLILVAVALSVPSTTQAAQLIVYPDGSGQWANIQAAVDECHSGDSILLAPGTFSGDGNVNIWGSTAQDVTVRSISGDPNTCTIDCAGGFAFAINASGWSFEGLTVTGVAADVAFHHTGACSGSTTYFRRIRYVNNSNAVFTDFATWLYFNRAEFHDSQFTANICNTLTGFVTLFRNCTFTDNRSGISGGYGGRFEHCVIARNTSRSFLFAAGSGGEYPGSLSFTGCTIFGNSCDLMFLAYECAVGISDCIIASNNYGQAIIDYCVDQLHRNMVAPAVRNCCIFGNGPGGNVYWDIACTYGVDNLAVDPLLCDPYAGDLSLCSNSPCLPANGASTLMGAIDSQCGSCGPVAIEPMTFGEVKALFR